MPTQSKKQKIILKLRSTPFMVVLSCAVLVGGALLSPYVRADQFDDQINALRAQNATAQNSLDSLTNQASSYQDAINQLQTQISGIQAAIADSTAQQADLQQKITDEQQKIDNQKSVLANDVKTVYINGQLTPVEMLATSNSISDYIDKQESYSKVQDAIQDTLKQIQTLQKSLQIKKAQVDQLLLNQRAQNDQLTTAQTKQAQLLAYNQDQQNAYTAQIASNSSQIAEERRLQIIANTKYDIGNFVGDPNNGGYPSAWANAGQDTVFDSWGMYNRECVSYTAFKVHQDYLAGKDSRDMPGWGWAGVGNANEWDDDARAAGIPVDGNPTPGSIAISNAGEFGHAMYVEAVNGNQVYVQQYNQQLNGQYSEGWRYTTGLVFIHF